MPSMPEDTIIGLIQAAERHNTPAYLSLFCDEFKVNLEKQVNHMGKEVFSRLLQENFKNLTGIALRHKRQASDDMLHLSVEFIYEGYDDMKSFLLKNINGDWKIKMITDDDRLM